MFRIITGSLIGSHEGLVWTTKIQRRREKTATNHLVHTQTEAKWNSVAEIIIQNFLVLLYSILQLDHETDCILFP